MHEKVIETNKAQTTKRFIPVEIATISIYGR